MYRIDIWKADCYATDSAYAMREELEAVPVRRVANPHPANPASKMIMPVTHLWYLCFTAARKY